MYWKYAIVLATAGLSLGLMVSAVWRQDARYSLPTPRPDGLKQTPIGDPISFAAVSLANSGKPLFLHFFNPNCPCSRFNLDHLRGLIRRHRDDVRFVAVLQGEGGRSKVKQAFEKLNLGIESVVDETGSIGQEAGVYSTPQAVLVDVEGRLYFRGNYNVSRYCAVRETEFARIALESMLAGKPAQPLTAAAATAYGCPRKNKELTRKW